MKKIVSLLIAATPIFSATAQSTKFVNAKNYIREFESSKDTADLYRAKANIDLCAVHPDTKDLPKTQTLKGQIYLTIFDTDLRLQTDKLASITDPNKRTLTAYQHTSSSSLNEAYTALVLAKMLDIKANYKEEIGRYVARISSHYENKAIADYNAKKYADALPSFEKAYEINGVKDTVSLSNCALVADRGGVYTKAKMYYQKMIDNKQGYGNTYSALVTIYLMLKDTIGGMDVLKKGRAAYPNDINLVITETNYFLKTNNSKEALNNLNIALAVKPAEANLYLVRGNVFDNMANPKSDNGKELDKPKDYDSNLKSAELDYKKAIELKPDYFDALYNLGVLYNNHGVAINKMANEITDNVKYKAANDLATAEFMKAMPVLEKALDVNPKDKSTMYALKQIYARMQLLDKLKAINERLKN